MNAHREVLSRPGPSQDGGKLVFHTCRCILRLYTINETREQYSLLDTILHYILDFGPPGNIYKNDGQVLLVDEDAFPSLVSICSANEKEDTGGTAEGLNPAIALGGFGQTNPTPLAERAWGGGGAPVVGTQMCVYLYSLNNALLEGSR